MLYPGGGRAGRPAGSSRTCRRDIHTQHETVFERVPSTSAPLDNSQAKLLSFKRALFALGLVAWMGAGAPFLLHAATARGP